MGMIIISAKVEAVSAKAEAVSAKVEAVSAKAEAVSAKVEAVSAKAEAVSAKVEAVSAKAEAVSAKAGGSRHSDEKSYQSVCSNPRATGSFVFRVNREEPTIPAEVMCCIQISCPCELNDTFIRRPPSHSL
jgi:hypothetical protein